MALDVRQQAAWWGGAAAAVLLVLWGLGDVILPFLAGGAIAYFLDPVVDRLQRLGLGRVTATLAVTLAAVLALAVALGLVVPTLVEQTRAAAAAAPEAGTRIAAFFETRFPQLMDETSSLRQGLASMLQAAQDRAADLLGGVVATAFSLVNVVLLLVVVPVVAFYLLLDWDRMVAAVDDLLPRDHAPTIRRLAAEIDRTLAGFVRGQGTVCLLLGTFYAGALSLAGLQFGLAIGAVAGLLAFIPYVGTIVGATLSAGFALVQFWGEWHMVALIAGIFAAGQAVEGNYLTPRLVGGSVGLHPVWLLFALSAFGALFGFAGLLVAVPAAAALGVLARFAIARYRESRLYRGRDAVLPDATPAGVPPGGGPPGEGPPR